MSDRRNGGTGNGNGHYRGEGPHIDPTQNVKELVELQACRQDEARHALAARLDQRDKLREVHRLEIARKDAEIQAKETERINAVNAVEKTRVDATFAEQRQATALAETSRRLEQAALAKEVATTATALATQTAAQTGRNADPTASEVKLDKLADLVNTLASREQGKKEGSAPYLGIIISVATAVLSGLAVTAFVLSRAPQ